MGMKSGEVELRLGGVGLRWVSFFFLGPFKG